MISYSFWYSLNTAKKKADAEYLKNTKCHISLCGLTSRGVRVEKDPADLEDAELVDRVCVVDPDPDSGQNDDGDCDCFDDDGDFDEDERNNSSFRSPILFA